MIFSAAVGDAAFVWAEEILHSFRGGEPVVEEWRMAIAGVTGLAVTQEMDRYMLHVLLPTSLRVLYLGRNLQVLSENYCSSSSGGDDDGNQARASLHSRVSLKTAGGYVFLARERDLFLVENSASAGMVLSKVSVSTPDLKDASAILSNDPGQVVDIFLIHGDIDSICVGLLMRGIPSIIVITMRSTTMQLICTTADTLTALHAVWCVEISRSCMLHALVRWKLVFMEEHVIALYFPELEGLLVVSGARLLLIRKAGALHEGPCNSGSEMTAALHTSDGHLLVSYSDGCLCRLALSVQGQSLVCSAEPLMSVQSEGAPETRLSFLMHADCLHEITIDGNSYFLGTSNFFGWQWFQLTTVSNEELPYER
jgi:hypothetical protein